MKKRKLRPTFLLQCVTLGLCVAFVVAVFFLAGIGMFSGVTLIAMLYLWFLGIEEGLLPDLLNYILTRKAENSTTPINSIWFINVDEEIKAEWNAHSDKTSNNPTIR